MATGGAARVILAAQQGIGAPTRYIVVDTPRLQPSTVTGGIYIRALSDIIFPALTVPGDLELTGDHDLTAGTIA